MACRPGRGRSLADQVQRDLAPVRLQSMLPHVDALPHAEREPAHTLGMPRQPAWFAAAVRTGLRLRARLLRLAPPRRTAYHHRPSTYPQGYRLGDLGPASMLDELDRRDRLHTA